MMSVLANGNERRYPALTVYQGERKKEKGGIFNGLTSFSRFLPSSRDSQRSIDMDPRCRESSWRRKQGNKEVAGWRSGTGRGRFERVQKGEATKKKTTTKTKRRDERNWVEKGAKETKSQGIKGRLRRRPRQKGRLKQQFEGAARLKEGRGGEEKQKGYRPLFSLQTIEPPNPFRQRTLCSRFVYREIRINEVRLINAPPNDQRGFPLVTTRNNAPGKQPCLRLSRFRNRSNPSDRSWTPRSSARSNYRINYRLDNFVPREKTREY